MRNQYRLLNKGDGTSILLLNYDYIAVHFSTSQNKQSCIELVQNRILFNKMYKIDITHNN